MLEEDTPRTDPWFLDPPDMRRHFLKSLARELEQDSEEKTNPHYSLAYKLLEDLTDNVLANHLSTAPTSSRDLFQEFGKARELVDQLMGAALSHDTRFPRPPRGNFWQHALRPEWVIRDKSYRLMMKAEVEGAAWYYLAQPLRSQRFDRTLIDMLIALELYQYVKDICHPDTVPGIPSQSPMKQMHPLLSTAIEIAVVGAIFALVCFGVFNLNPGGDWGGWVIGAAGFIAALVIIWDVVTLPLRWINWRKVRARANAMLDSMLTTYQSLHSDSVISTSHVRDRVKVSADQGIVWPSPLYVVLEDSIARGGRL